MAGAFLAHVWSKGMRRGIAPILARPLRNLYRLETHDSVAGFTREEAERDLCTLGLQTAG